jgi:ABC-type transporter Mla maintaining outer membrane lipid asymmetry ATPase subunit MlaF
VLLYDEPTAGLDPIASTVVEDLIRSVHMKGEDAVGQPGQIASYVVVTHQHSTISRAVDRLCSVQTLQFLSSLLLSDFAVLNQKVT